MPPFNGAGTFNNVAGNPVVTGTSISSITQNNTTSDYATGFTTCIAKDGQSVPTANIPMGAFKITGLGAATARTDAASLANIQDGTGVYVATVGGTADAITLTPSPAIAAYAAGQKFSWIASGANTTAATVQVSGIAGPKALTKQGSTALVANDILSGALVEAEYDGTRFQLIYPGRAFIIAGAVTTSGLTQTTNRVLGRTTAATGAIEELTAGSGMMFANGSITSLPRNYLAGAEIANGTDAVNDINVAAGFCTDSTNVFGITIAAMAGKQLDANWAPGAAAGMRNSAAAITDATYGIYAVAKADGTQDIYAYNNATSTTIATVLTALQAESGGASYIYARRIFNLVRVGATIKAFKQLGDLVTWDIPVNDVAAVVNGGTSAITRTLTVPIGHVVEAWFSNYENEGTANRYVLWTALDQTDSVPAIGLNSLSVFASAAVISYNGQFRIKTNTAAQIRYRASAYGAADVSNVVTNGFIDRRGRDT